MSNVPVLTYTNIADGVFVADVALDSSISNLWNVALNGTGPNGERVAPKYLIADNSGNKTIAFVTLQGFTYSVSPFSRKNFTLSDKMTTLGVQTSGGILVLTVSNIPLGIPDDINQYAVPTNSSGSTPGMRGFNPVDKSPTLVLTNSNLTANNNTVSNFANARGFDAHLTGKYYFEFSFNVAAHALTGFANAAYPIGTGNEIDLSTNAIAYNPAAGQMVANGAGLGPALAVPITANGKFAVDFGAKLLWVAQQGQTLWNGGNGDPGTGANGISIATILASGSLFIATTLQTIGDTVTINTGGLTFNDGVPSGFAPGW